MIWNSEKESERSWIVENQDNIILDKREYYEIWI